jgi:cholesterol transport system auxiliary component
MAYTKQPPRLAYFAYNEWVDTPARMVAAMLGEHLEASGLFRAVLTGSADIRTDLRLDSEIRSLQQDFNASGSTLFLEIKVSLIDVSSRSLLNARSFRYREPVDHEGPEAGAVAANRAADRFLTDLKQFVADTIGGLDCPAGNLPVN